MIAPSLIVIRAEDPERVAHFYGAMGLRFTRESHGKGPDHMACSLDGFVFEIYPRGGADHTRATRLGFTVANLDDTLDAIRTLGGQVVPSPTHTEWGRRAVLLDPEGHKVELTERLTADTPAMRQ